MRIVIYKDNAMPTTVGMAQVKNSAHAEWAETLAHCTVVLNDMELGIYVIHADLQMWHVLEIIDFIRPMRYAKSAASWAADWNYFRADWRPE